MMEMIISIDNEMMKSDDSNECDDLSCITLHCYRKRFVIKPEIQKNQKSLYLYIKNEMFNRNEFL
jgi:hypothetical protein